MATLKDVAALSGLTVTTVSRVLNNRGYISKDARKKVYDAMKELNYRPNEVARSLSKRTTNTIGVIVPHIRHPYFAEMISCLERAANSKGYKIILCNSQGEEYKEREYMEMCTSNCVAGIILFSAGVAVEEFVGNNIPLITVERFLENGTASVECDNKQGGILAARHLISKGCRRMLYVSGVEETSMPADDRRAGFAQVCNENGIAYREVSTHIEQYNRLDYYELIESTLLRYPDTDGIFASSDLIAAQTLQVCAKLKKRVPQDIKVVGFDDVEITRLTVPPITTIHQPVMEMAQMAVDLLVSAANGNTVAKRSLLPVTLVERDSTGTELTFNALE